MILSFWKNSVPKIRKEEKTRTQKKLENHFGKNAKDNGKTMVHFRFGGPAIIVITLSGSLSFLFVYQNEMDTFFNSKNVFFLIRICCELKF